MTYTKHTLRYFLLAIMWLATSTFSLAGTSGKNTAAYYKAHVDDYLGKKVSLEIPYIRALAEGPEAEFGFRIMVAPTVDEEQRTGGGRIAIIVEADDVDKLVRKYGTNAERKGAGKGLELDKIRGVLRVLSHEKKRDMIYLDLTDGGAEDLPELVQKRILKETKNKKHL